MGDRDIRSMYSTHYAVASAAVPMRSLKPRKTLSGYGDNLLPFVSPPRYRPTRIVPDISIDGRAKPNARVDRDDPETFATMHKTSYRPIVSFNGTEPIPPTTAPELSGPTRNNQNLVGRSFREAETALRSQFLASNSSPPPPPLVQKSIRRHFPVDAENGFSGPAAFSTTTHAAFTRQEERASPTDSLPYRPAGSFHIGFKEATGYSRGLQPLAQQRPRLVEEEEPAPTTGARDAGSLHPRAPNKNYLIDAPGALRTIAKLSYPRDGRYLSATGAEPIPPTLAMEPTGFTRNMSTTAGRPTTPDSTRPASREAITTYREATRHANLPARSRTAMGLRHSPDPPVTPPCAQPTFASPALSPPVFSVGLKEPTPFVRDHQPFYTGNAWVGEESSPPALCLTRKQQTRALSTRRLDYEGSLPHFTSTVRRDFQDPTALAAHEHVLRRGGLAKDCITAALVPAHGLRDPEGVRSGQCPELPARVEMTGSAFTRSIGPHNFC
ncbi:hypothetical protein PAPYR_5752 [Paratrimastix pyriformis]|uniref:Uncharacterized protein n=1 Tax=Paratrimastix pyriformis TaxID=342808 RepID=A0ABQ8ULG7_9EUKA|nr:hypothetical protein PAPYR_5752 [Paratrimastix pyriformis]